MGSNGLAIQHITPRIREMMHRLVRGQRPKQIADDMGITQGRLSIIIHSPLFQLELNKLMAKREEKLFEIQEGFLDAAELGVKFHKEILGSKPGEYLTETKLKSATAMTLLASKLLSTSAIGQPKPELDEELTYEERLRRVTFEEKVKLVPKDGTQKDEPVEENLEGLLTADYPPDEALALDTGGEGLDELKEEDPFSAPDKLDAILAKAGGMNN